MQRLLRPLSLSLLLTVSLPAFGQAPEGTPGSLPERVRPSNLSLPRDDARPVVWSARTGPDGVTQENPQPSEDVLPGVRDKACNCQRPRREEGAGLPYGTGFEARQRGGAGGHGMGRGR